MLLILLWHLRICLITHMSIMIWKGVLAMHLPLEMLSSTTEAPGMAQKNIRGTAVNKKSFCVLQLPRQAAKNHAEEHRVMQESWGVKTRGKKAQATSPAQAPTPNRTIPLRLSQFSLLSALPLSPWFPMPSCRTCCSNGHKEVN